jgi:DNA-binding transcriptional regulator YdaS (Cro superfamily)
MSTDKKIVTVGEVSPNLSVCQWLDWNYLSISRLHGSICVKSASADCRPKRLAFRQTGQE